MGMESQWKNPDELFEKPELTDAPQPDFAEKATPVADPIESMQVKSRLRKGGYKTQEGEFLDRPLTKEEMEHIEKDPHFNEGSDSERMKKIRRYIRTKDNLN